MKKALFGLSLYMCIFCLTENANAYSTNQYSVDIPSTYIKQSEDSPINSSIKEKDGSSDSFIEEDVEENRFHVVNITVKPSPLPALSGNNSKIFTEESLNLIENEYIKQLEINGINEKEITYATKNNYKCFHLIIVYDDFCTEQYFFVSNNNIYLLNICVAEKEDLQSSEIIDIVNSFTISNYKDPEEAAVLSSEDNYKRLKIVTSIACIITIIISLFVKIIKTKHNQQSTNEEQTKCN